jgi:cellulose synthase/poly-beta-1,6-N-acetylglucosamine synthase-like glycosyltransferase
MFLPISTWDSIIKFFGAEPFPAIPVVMYFIRVTSATYVAVGVFLIILALRPMAYGVIVPFSGWASIVLGVVCAITGYMENMPTCWFLGDSLSCIVFGVLIVIFWQKAKRTARVEQHEQQ